MEDGTGTRLITVQGFKMHFLQGFDTAKDSGRKILDLSKMLFFQFLALLMVSVSCYVVRMQFADNAVATAVQMVDYHIPRLS